MEKSQSRVVLLLVIFVFPILSIAQAESSDSVISGQVLDYLTNEPIKNATISIWCSSSRLSNIGWTLSKVEKTDSNGRFSVKVKGGFQYRVYAYHLNPYSTAFDYAPALREFPLIENITLSFRLTPAASITFDGRLWFVESTKPSEQYSFTLVDNSVPKLNSNVCINSYGTSFNSFSGLSPNRIVVPTHRNVTVIVNASVIVGTTQIFKVFAVNDIASLNLTNGGMVQVDIRKYSSKANFDITYDRLGFSEALLRDLEREDFYVVVEKQDLMKVRNLLVLAEAKYASGLYDECHADLREGYIGVVTTIQRLEEIHINASFSVFFLILFLAFTALALSFILFERPITRGLMSIPFFALFFFVFYQTYPGCRLVLATSLIIFATVSLGVAFTVALVLPLFLRERVISIVSMANLNLRRRKLRFVLTLISTAVLVMSFVSLTSFSAGYGLTIKPFYSLSSNPQGLLIKQPMPSEYRAFNFIPMDPLTIDLLRQKKEVLSLGPKAESLPMQASFGFLSSLTAPSKGAPIYGILGIQPSTESMITHIERTIVQGRYLMDTDEDAILISSNLAKELGILVNEKATLDVGSSRTEFKVVGLFDGNLFASVRDVNGEPLIPKKMIMIEGMQYPVLRPCEFDEILITAYENALKTPGVFLSRIDILTKDLESGLPLARQIALEQGLQVSYSTGSQNYEIVVGSYLEARGTSIIIPWIIVILSAIITMLNSIFEQRREIAILSSIGLNPSHITGLFIAEAAIIGIIGGGVGYLLGLGSYKLMAFFSIVVEVRSKISAAWSLAAVSVSLAAVLVGALVALRSSVVITPSLMRRWMAEERTPSFGKSWTFQMPIRLREEDLDSMFNYVISRFQGKLQEVGIDIDSKDFILKLFDEETAGIKTKTFKFSCVPRQRLSIGGVSFSLIANKGKDDNDYSLKVLSGMGRDVAVYKTVDFLRMALVEWSSPKRK